VDFLYLIDFCLEDISIFKSLYGKYNILLILVAILLLIVMVGAISLCLSTKNILISVRRAASPKDRADSILSVLVKAINKLFKQKMKEPRVVQHLVCDL